MWTRCWKLNAKSVRHLEWHNNASFRYTYPRRPYQDEIPPRLFCHVCRRAKLVTSLTIQMTRVSNFHPGMILVLNSMIHIQRASISIYLLPEAADDRIAIDEMFPLLGRVEQLELTGNWYLPSGDNPAALEPARRWKAKVMKLEADNLTLSGNATELTRLNVNEHRASFPASLHEVRHCQQLEELFLDRPGELAHFHTTLATFKKLREVAFHLTSASQIECLTMAPPNPSFTNPSQPRAQLPRLRRLTIKSSTLSTDNERTACCRSLGKALQLYTGLAALSVQGLLLNPGYIFSTEGTYRWSCKQLVDLRLELAPLTTTSDQEKLKSWNAFYAQLGQLKALRFLSVICTEIDKSLEAGLNALSGAQDLEFMVLSDRSQTLWAQEDVTNLLGAVPALRYIDVHPLPLENHRQVAAWVRDIDHHIVVNFIDNGNATQ
ncbi:hypothetical protein BGX23_002732 [Mortierella sp. AD031]|nr:hypothetical protein BGX23_002732 [Mortierella sp. AD031]